METGSRQENASSQKAPYTRTIGFDRTRGALASVVRYAPLLFSQNAAERRKRRDEEVAAAARHHELPSGANFGLREAAPKQGASPDPVPRRSILPDHHIVSSGHLRSRLIVD